MRDNPHASGGDIQRRLEAQRDARALGQAHRLSPPATATVQFLLAHGYAPFPAGSPALQMIGAELVAAGLAEPPLTRCVGCDLSALRREARAIRAVAEAAGIGGAA